MLIDTLINCMYLCTSIYLGAYRHMSMGKIYEKHGNIGKDEFINSSIKCKGGTDRFLLPSSSLVILSASDYQE